MFARGVFGVSKTAPSREVRARPLFAASGTAGHDLQEPRQLALSVACSQKVAKRQKCRGTMFLVGLVGGHHAQRKNG